MQNILYEQFAKLEDQYWWFRGRRKIILDTIAKRCVLARSTTSILDIGCGTGRMLRELEHFGKARGIDSSPEAVAISNKNAPSATAALGTFPGNLPPGRFNLVTLLDVLEHVEDDSAGLEALHKVLDHRGYVIVTVPAYHWLWSNHDNDSHHVRRYTKRSLEQTIKDAGFSIEYISYFNTVLFPLIAGYKLLSNMRRNRQPHLDVAIFGWMNTLLAAIFGLESAILAKVALPYGVSILAVIQQR